MLRAVLSVALASVVGCGGDDDGVVAPGPAALELGAVIALPYVAAGAGAASRDVAVRNPGGEPLAALTWRLDGDADFTIVAAPVALAAGGEDTLTVRWAGAAEPRIAGATLAVDSELGVRTAEVWAVAGDPALESARFAAVTGPGGVVIGESAVAHLPTAPYPAPGRPWTDDRVHVFVPADYRERDAHDLVLHFHGHNTTIDATVPAHRYREHVYASGADVILVVPQGPVNAASGDFGKLASPVGTARFLDEVLTVLYRAGTISRPVLGDVTLTSHSGGYSAAAQNLGDASFAVVQVDLFDSLYGYLATYADFARGGGRLRSNYTASGGTDANNRSLATTLGTLAVTAVSQRALRDAAAVIYFTAASHGGATGDDGAYYEQLRWGARHSRRGPRVELRSAVAAGGRAMVTWLAPRDGDVTGWQVETSPDGQDWTVSAQVGADADRASFALTVATRVRVVAVIDGVAVADRQRSDVYRVTPDANVLVVDGFDRVIGGSWAGLAHDFAAVVGEAAGAVHTASNEAITEDGLDLTSYRTVIWLCGDESLDDHTFTAAEQAMVERYVAGGGRVILSGSEIGFELSASAGGRAWLATTTGATFAADDAGTDQVRGAGALAAVPGFGFGGAGAPYAEEFPDRFVAGTGATVVLAYATGGGAAVAVAGRGAIVGFPLELIDTDEHRAAVVQGLLQLVAR